MLAYTQSISFLIHDPVNLSVSHAITTQPCLQGSYRFQLPYKSLKNGVKNYIICHLLIREFCMKELPYKQVDLLQIAPPLQARQCSLFQLSIISTNYNIQTNIQTITTSILNAIMNINVFTKKLLSTTINKVHNLLNENQQTQITTVCWTRLIQHWMKSKQTKEQCNNNIFLDDLT
ncbi:Hypothetical_protein [Hexamita inflata]|uniref:Hypothetical_protein n=1 Tax=Hexamita inflata TaxID=28002 RepID=A0AA86QDV0_9EUKA|nr:Hypothetical protein HINF_LOCUS45109 [Hexamita inflata]